MKASLTQNVLSEIWDKTKVLPIPKGLIYISHTNIQGKPFARRNETPIVKEFKKFRSPKMDFPILNLTLGWA